MFQKFKNKYFFLVIVLFFACLFFRLYELGRLNLWRDEAFSVLLVQKNFSEFIEISLKDTSSFLFNTLLYFWVKVFGTTEIAIRLPSVIFSMGSFCFLYLITKKQFKKIESLVILALFSVNIVSIFYAQEARVYSLLSFLVLGSFYYFFGILENFSRRKALGFIIFSALSFYAHSYAAFFLVAEFIYLIFYLYKKRIFRKILQSTDFKRWFVIYLSMFVVILPWLIVNVSLLKSVNSGFWISFHPLDTFKETITGFAVGIRLFSSEEFDTFESVLNTFIILLSFAGTISEIFKKDKVCYSLFFWFPFLSLYLISFYTPVLYIRYVSFLSPFFMILTFKGMKAIFKKRFVIIAGMVIILNLRIFLDYSVQDSSKPAYKNLTAYIEEHFESNDSIIHKDGLTLFPYKYYSRRKSTIYDPSYETPFYVGRVLMTEDDFTRDLSEIKKYNRLWVIGLSEINLEEEFENDFILKQETTFSGDLHLELWEQR